TAFSSSTSMTNSRTVKSSWAAWLVVLTLCNATLPCSISSASLRNTWAVLVSSRPKANFPAFRAQSAALNMMSSLVVYTSVDQKVPILAWNGSAPHSSTNSFDSTQALICNQHAEPRQLSP